MFLPTRMKWYSRSASPHRAASGAQSWRAPRGGTNKCTAKEGSLRTYCSIPYTGLHLHRYKQNLKQTTTNGTRYSQLYISCEKFRNVKVPFRLLAAIIAIRESTILCNYCYKKPFEEHFLYLGANKILILGKV